MVKRAREIGGELIWMVLHSAGALVALGFAIFSARAWAARGFPISAGHYLKPFDDGSFWALLFSSFFFMYCSVAVARWAVAARDAAHKDNDNPTI